MFIKFGSKPLTVTLNQESIDALTKAAKQQELVPGDVVDKDNPLDIGPIDISGYTSMSLIMHVKNISAEPVQFYAKGSQGPIGALSEVDIITYNRPLVPGEEFVWRTAGLVFGANLYAHFWVTGDGAVDIQKGVVLSSATATCCP